MKTVHEQHKFDAQKTSGVQMEFLDWGWLRSDNRRDFSQLEIARE